MASWRLAPTPHGILVEHGRDTWLLDQEAALRAAELLASGARGLLASARWLAAAGRGDAAPLVRRQAALVALLAATLRRAAALSVDLRQQERELAGGRL